MNKFELALNDNPEDWDLRLIYADYLEDNANPMLNVGWQRTNVVHM